jgi:hypothetical protein
MPLVISTPEQMIVDFYTETFGPLVTNVTNNIFFQAWATSARADVYDFKNARLRALLKNNTLVLV